MLLKLKDIKKKFSVKKGLFSGGRDFIRAVDGVSLSIKKGENVGLVGESGCGKTTLAGIILKLMPHDSGQIVFDGRDITGFTARQMRGCRKHMQIVFQDPYSSLDPRFTIRNIIREAMVLEKNTRESVRAQDSRIRDVLRSVNLQGDILDRYPHEFSGGERQRIAIARAIIINPQLLVLDEAVSSLDVIIQRDLIRLLVSLQEKFDLTYLFISHNMKVVKKISKKIAVMYKGRIVELAATEEIFNNPLHPYTKELLCAAVQYKPVERDSEIEIRRDAKLINRGKGHFVME